MRQRMAMLFVALANVMILADAVLPHPHHDRLSEALADVICSLYHQHDDQALCHNRHSHDCKGDACEFSHAVAASSCRFDKDEKEDDDHCDNLTLLAPRDAAPQTAATGAVAITPWLEGFLPRRAAGSHGLRAPPVG